MRKASVGPDGPLPLGAERLRGRKVRAPSTYGGRITSGGGFFLSGKRERPQGTGPQRTNRPAKPAKGEAGVRVKKVR